MGNVNKGIKGEWLRIAIKAQGESFRSVAKKLRVRPDKYTMHVKSNTHLSAESLAELARLFPDMNIRYVLTGEGQPKSPA